MNKSIAIDGPCGAGKSSVAGAVAKRLGGHYLDTGAMYRAAGVYMLENGVSTDDAESVAKNISNADIDVKYDASGAQHTYLNGRDITGSLRTPEVSMAASKVGAVGEVRRFLVARQKALAEKLFLVCDGRDIGTVVIPDAALKIYLTADAEERARRRFNEMADKACGFESVLEDVNRRDYNDMHRAESPLTKAEDAVVVDSTHMTIDEVVEHITGLYLQRMGN